MTPEILVLKGPCVGCGATSELWASNCKHKTICQPCGKAMIESGATCSDCGASVTRLIREKYKAKPWILEDDIGQQQFIGQLEGGQQATYYLLMMQGQDFIAVPAGSWYNFHKVAHYKQLTLEEAEEQMKNRRKTADGYQRWMMKAANTGAAAFGDVEKVGGSGGSGGHKKGGDEDENAADSDKAEEDEDEEEARKNRLGMNKGAGGAEEDGEEPANDLDLDDEEPEKGDDWEHEETFTDDDEAVGNDPEERDDQAPEQPPPPEIKQEEEDEEEGQEGQEEEGGGLSKSGKELKKLLGKSAGLDESDGEDDEEEDEDVDLDNEDIGLSPVLAPTRKDGPKEEQTDGSPAKATKDTKSTPAAIAAGKSKRKAGAMEETKVNGAGAKKAKTEVTKTPPSSAKKEPTSTAKTASTPPIKGSAVAGKGTPAVSAGVTEEEVIKVLRQTGPIKSTDLVAKFRSRLKTQEDKDAFAAILKKISRIQKTDGLNYIVLRDK